jgi:hypothetical protein
MCHLIGSGCTGAARRLQVQQALHTHPPCAHTHTHPCTWMLFSITMGLATCARVHRRAETQTRVVLSLTRVSAAAPKNKEGKRAPLQDAVKQTCTAAAKTPKNSRQWPSGCCCYTTHLHHTQLHHAPNQTWDWPSHPQSSPHGSSSAVAATPA